MALVLVCWSEGGPLASLRIMGPGWRRPQVGTDAIQVIYDLSVLDRKLAKQLLLAIEAFVHHVSKAKIAVFHAEHRDICDRTLREIAQLLVFNLMRRMRRHLGHNFL